VAELVDAGVEPGHALLGARRRSVVASGDLPKLRDVRVLLTDPA